jgi:hypothetical protein
VQVLPTEAQREAPYIQNNIDATRASRPGQPRPTQYSAVDVATPRGEGQRRDDREHPPADPAIGPTYKALGQPHAVPLPDS